MIRILYDEAGVENKGTRLENPNIQRYKGLGEMS